MQVHLKICQEDAIAVHASGQVQFLTIFFVIAIENIFMYPYSHKNNSLPITIYAFQTMHSFQIVHKIHLANPIAPTQNTEKKQLVHTQQTCLARLHPQRRN